MGEVGEQRTHHFVHDSGVVQVGYCHILQPWSPCHLHLPCWQARGRTRVHVDALSHMHSFGTPALWAVLRRAPLETLW